MAQTQTYSQVLNMACMLPLKDKKRLIYDMQVNIAKENAADDIDMIDRPVREQLLESVLEGEREIDRGECYTQEEALEMMQSFKRQYEKMAV